MGIAFSYIDRMERLGLIRRGMSILDIGSSNLYSAPAAGIADFVRKYGPPDVSGVEDFAARLAAGSAYDPVRGGLNEAFAGELFEKAGMRYESLDIADGYRTTILDLNTAALPAELQRRFDLVLNFGTTEHILNQMNCFRVIHDATSVGGYIYHSLPAVGYVNHGYVTYTGRCFFDVASFNRYELVACWFDGPAGRNSIFDSLEAHSADFPVLGKAVKEFAATAEGRALRDVNIPDIGINVVCRKRRDAPFMGALESSTSVGLIPRAVTAAYGVGMSKGAVSKAKRRVASALRGHPWLYSVARRIYRAASGRY